MGNKYLTKEEKENILTKTQEKVYRAIYDFVNENGYSPTVRELCNLCGNSSTATMFVHLKELERKGYIKQEKGKPRTMKLLWRKYE